MSEYFRILNRVENEQADVELNSGSKPLTSSRGSQPAQAPTKRRAGRMRSTEESRRPATSLRGDEDTEQTARAPRTPDTAQRPRSAPSAGRPGLADSFARTFDNLRAMAAERGLSSIVVASASGMESVEPVIAGLAGEASRRRMRTVLADLVEQEGAFELRPRLVERDEPDEPAAGDVAGTEFQRRRGPLPTELVDWVKTTLSRSELLIVHGPSLGRSVDSALVARATDGLILVMEPGVTDQALLVEACNRARAVGCKLLGLVASGSKDETPAWMKQVTG